MNKIIKRLYEIQKRPGMYLGQKSLMYLYMYISGYDANENENNPNWKGLLPGFQDFIEERYKIHTHGWAYIITFYEVTDEAAFDRFYVLLNEFLQENALGLENL